MQMKNTYRFQEPKLDIIAAMVYPIQNPLYEVIIYIKGIPITVVPAIHIIKTVY